MSPTEAVMLTGYLHAHFPQQPVDEYTTEALSELLAPYAANDCRTAVLNIAERGEKWCSPTDVRAEVKRIRARRIDSTPLPEPPPSLTIAEYPGWLAEERRRAADGLPPSGPPALERPDRAHLKRLAVVMGEGLRGIDTEENA